MMAQAEERDETPKQMLLALKKEMNSLKDEEDSLKAQILSLNEQFQLLVKSAAEIYPEVLDGEFPKKAAARQRNRLQHRPFKGPDSDTGKAIGVTRTPSFTKGSYKSQESPLRRPVFDLKRFPRRYIRLTSEEAAAQFQEQFENNANVASGIDARKIRSSIPNSPTDETVISPVVGAETPDDERRERLKKKMLESRKVDVVNLGLFWEPIMGLSSHIPSHSSPPTNTRVYTPSPLKKLKVLAI